jgi:hypothetical protein
MSLDSYYSQFITFLLNLNSFAWSGNSSSRQREWVSGSQTPMFHLLLESALPEYADYMVI